MKNDFDEICLVCTYKSCISSVGWSKKFESHLYLPTCQKPVLAVQFSQISYFKKSCMLFWTVFCGYSINIKVISLKATSLVRLIQVFRYVLLIFWYRQNQDSLHLYEPRFTGLVGQHFFVPKIGSSLISRFSF